MTARSPNQPSDRTDRTAMMELLPSGYPGHKRLPKMQTWKATTEEAEMTIHENDGGDLSTVMAKLAGLPAADLQTVMDQIQTLLDVLPADTTSGNDLHLRDQLGALAGGYRLGRGAGKGLRPPAPVSRQVVKRSSATGREVAGLDDCGGR